MIDEFSFIDSIGSDEGDERPLDPAEERAREDLMILIEADQEQVFFSRQLEVQYEDKYFHWITNRAIRDLENEGYVKSDKRKMKTGGDIKLYYHKGFRYYKRSANNIVALVETYSDKDFGESIGIQGELMIQSGFAGCQFIQMGTETRTYNGKTWTETEHNLDFIYERDGISYGVEVKNTLSYMDKVEFDIKIELCQHLGIRPVFAVRMLPRAWINDLVDAGGFALIFKYQLYPVAHRDFAKKIRTELKLPVDAPRRLNISTMNRFLKWHNEQLNV